MTFKELELMPAITKAVDELGYVTPSPIQEQAIPPVLAGRDLIGCAQTGTGKTAAFAIPILQHLAQHPARGHRPIRALVLTPTRELALQIKQSFEDYGCYLDVKNTVVFGGVGQGPQVSALRSGVDVLVATPGRLNDLCNQGHIDLSQVEYFVLDEADRMLDMGFIHDVRKVLARLPDKNNRHTLLFSATMPKEIAALAQQILNDPIKVAVTPVSSTVDAIVQSVYKVDKGNKRYLLAELLKKHPEFDSVLVFTRTKHGADRVVKDLAAEKVEAMAIHGNKSQTARQTALSRFKAGEIRVLVATDIAARGIDINGLACVLNYELPNIPETYVHRIGRTGRAGRDGVAISFCNFDELPYLKDIEKLIGKKVPEVADHAWPMMILEATPKAERAPRPPRTDRAPRGPRAPQTNGGDARQNRGSRGPRKDNAPRSEGTGRGPRSENGGGNRGPRTESGSHSQGQGRGPRTENGSAGRDFGAQQASGRTNRQSGGRPGQSRGPRAENGSRTQGQGRPHRGFKRQG